MHCIETLHEEFSKWKMFGSLRILLFVEALANFYFFQTIDKGVVFHYQNKSRLRRTVTHAYTSQHATIVVL